MIGKATLLTCVAVAVLAGQTRGRSVIAHPISKPGWLGVGLVEVTPERAKALNLKDELGVEVTQVEDGSPAAKAGIREHDVILDINGQKVEGGLQFIRIVGEAGPGTAIGMGVWRNGARQTLTATLDARPAYIITAPSPLPPMPNLPDFEALTGQSPIVGFEGETLTPQLAEYFGVKEGVLVRTVTPRTPAERAGLKAGDVVIRVTGTPVSSPREISGLVHAAHAAPVFTVMRNHKEVTLKIELALP